MKKIVLILSLIFLLDVEVGVICAQTSAAPAAQTLHIGGNVQTPLALTVPDLTSRLATNDLRAGFAC